MPGLADTGYEATSNRNPAYNCFAWAARRSDTVMDPPGTASFAFWPDGVPTWDTLDNYVRAYEALGFSRCDDGSLEAGYEKIALFKAEDGTASHAARQLPNGRWTSKLGKGIDIEHDLSDLDGQRHMGTVDVYMRIACNEPPPKPHSSVLVVSEMPEQFR